MSKSHYFDKAGICVKCDQCEDPDCCDQTEECFGTNWDFMNRIEDIAKEIMERRKKEN